MSTLTQKLTNDTIVNDIYEAFGRGDIQAILDQLTDDVKWNTHIDPIVPWSGDFSGKKNIPGFFKAIAESVNSPRLESIEGFADGDAVVKVGTFSCTPKSTGKSVTARWAMIWKFNSDGKVVSYEQFHAPEIADAFRN